MVESNPNPNPNPNYPPSLQSSIDLEDSNGGHRDMKKKKRKIDELEDTAKEPEPETLEGSSHGLGNGSSSNAVQRDFKCNFCHRKFTTPQALGGHQNAHKMDRAMIKQQREIEGMHPHFLPYNYHPYNNYYNAMSSRSMYEPFKGIVPNNRSMFEPFKAAPFGVHVDRTMANRSMYEPFKGASLVDPSMHTPHLNWGTMPFPNRAYRLRQGIGNSQLMGGFNQTRPTTSFGVVCPSDQNDMPLARAPLQVSSNDLPHEKKDAQELDLSLKL